MKEKPNLLIRIAKKLMNTFWSFIDTLSYKSEKIANTYYNKSIGIEYRKEYSIFGINNNKRILHIGCGAFPLTELTLAEETGANIVGIDKNEKVIPFAQDIVTKRKLQNKIKIDYGNGVNYPVNGFDMIIISSCATPMIEIVDHIVNDSKKNAIIIVRELDLAIRPLLEYIRSNSNISILKKVDHYPFPIVYPLGWQAFYLVKK